VGEGFGNTEAGRNGRLANPKSAVDCVPLLILLLNVLMLSPSKDGRAADRWQATDRVGTVLRAKAETAG
jgi:hypothetical protein